MSKTARMVIKYCISHDIGTLVAGYNESFQRETSLGRKNNQSFVSIPYGRLIKKLEYLCELYGITFAKQEESYTSKASFFDGDDIPVYSKDDPGQYTFSGKRIHRGMYRCSNGMMLNADINGALNILKKATLWT